MTYQPMIYKTYEDDIRNNIVTDLVRNPYTMYLVNRKGKSWVKYLTVLIGLLEVKRLLEFDGFYILRTSHDVIIQFDPWLTTISILSDLDNPSIYNTFRADSNKGKQIIRDLALWQSLKSKGTSYGFQVIL